MKIYFRGILFLLAALLPPFPSWGKTTGVENGFGKAGSIKIVIALPTEGSYSFFSRQFINGLLLSLGKQAGGRKINYIIKNLPISAGNKSIGKMFSSLAKKKVSAVIGPIFEGQLKYFAYNSAMFKIPVITPSPVVSGKDFSPYVFNYGMTLKQEIKTEIEYAKYADLSSVAVIYPDYGYGLKLLHYIVKFSKKYGINISDTTAYSEKTVDFFYNFNSIVKFKNTAAAHNISKKEAELGVTKYNMMHGITKLKPIIPFGGLFVIGGPSKLGLILTQLMYYNITGFPIFGLSPFDSESFIEKYGFYMRNAIFTDGFFKHDDNRTVKAFAAAYKKNYGEMPNILSAEGYDIGGIVIKAAERINLSYNKDIDAVSVKSPYIYVFPQKRKEQPQKRLFAGGAEGLIFYRALLRVRRFKGVCGESRLSVNTFKKNLYLFKYKNNQVYILETPF